MVAAAPRVLGVCADDIGLVDGAAETALRLAAAGRLSAASCVTTAAGWPSAAAVLASGHCGAEPGLHFNLTEGRPLSPDLAAHWPTLPTLGRLLWMAQLGRLPLAAIEVEWRAQVEAFTAALGRRPAFVDGHQHVHALAGVRAIVLEGVAAWPATGAIRNTGRVLGPGAWLKRRAIESLGGRALQRELVARGLRTNQALLGAYDFDATDYRRHMQGWLANAPADGGLLFCHPCASARAAAGRDPIAAARRREAAYLESDAFVADLAASRTTVGAAWAVQSSSAG